MRFGITEKPMTDCVSSYNTLVSSLKCPKTASETAENFRCRQPHCRLTPPPQETSANIRKNLIRQKLESLAYIFAADSVGLSLSSFTFLWWAPKDACVLKQSA